MSTKHILFRGFATWTAKRKFWLSLLFAIVFLTGLIYFVYWLVAGRFYETTDDAYVQGNLVQVMSQISGKVNYILADETDYVKKNQPLLILDKVDAEIALKSAESQLALVVRQVSQLYSNVSQMRSDVQVQQSNFSKAQDDLKRREGLVVNKTISSEELQHAKIAYEVAKNSLALANNKLQAAIALVANTDLYHHPQVTQAAAKVRDACISLQRTTIYAPDSGYIAKRNVQIGQEINSNTVLMVIVPLNQIWINANFKESQLKHFRIGQPAQVISDIYGSDVIYRGRVIGLSPGTGGTFDLLPPQNATGNWIKIVQRVPVRIALDPAQLRADPLQLGLSVTVTIDSHNRRGAKLTNVAQRKIVSATQTQSSSLEQADALVNKIIRDNAANVSLTTLPK